jgi:uncharacterized protein YabN with tetrapyrrole methylase and pyrophosphatase domain
MAASYTVDEKAMAIAIVQRFDGLTAEALRTIKETIGRCPSKSTLHGWCKGSPNPNETERTSEQRKKIVTIEDITAAHSALDDKFEELAHKYLDRAVEEDVIDKMKGRELVTSAAIAVDKMRLLRDLPTEIIEVIPTVQKLWDAASKRGIDPLAILDSAIAGVQKYDVSLN